jgi:nitrogen regulatory protein PII-like uncharacterized protein
MSANVRGLDDIYPGSPLDNIDPIKVTGRYMAKGGLIKTVGAVVVTLFVLYGVAMFLGCANLKNASNTLTNFSVRQSYARQRKHCDPNVWYTLLVGYDNRTCELVLQEFVDKAIATGTVKVEAEAIDTATMDQFVDRGIKALDHQAKAITSAPPISDRQFQSASFKSPAL